MTTGNVTPTALDTKSRPVIEDAMSKILDSIECKNIKTQDLPPLTTTQEFVDTLRINAGLNQPHYEGWFFHRTGFREDSSAITNFTQYDIVHDMIVTGLAFHGSFDESYKYIQDKTEELFWTLEKNKNMVGNSSIEYIEGMRSVFSFEQFGEMYLYKSQTQFTAHSLMIETNGRVYTS